MCFHPVCNHSITPTSGHTYLVSVPEKVDVVCKARAGTWGLDGFWFGMLGVGTVAKLRLEDASAMRDCRCCATPWDASSNAEKGRSGWRIIASASCWGIPNRDRGSALYYEVGRRML